MCTTSGVESGAERAETDLDDAGRGGSSRWWKTAGCGCGLRRIVHDAAPGVDGLGGQRSGWGGAGRVRMRVRDGGGGAGLG